MEKRKIEFQTKATGVAELVPDISLEKVARNRAEEAERADSARAERKVSSRLLLIDNKEGISPRDCSATVTALPGRVCSLTDIISNFAEDGEGRGGERYLLLAGCYERPA